MLSSEPGGGVSWCKGVELHGDPALQAPSWAKTLRDFRLLTPAEIAEWRETVATVNAGYSFESIMIHPPLYLARLTQELRRRGVTMQQRRVVDIEAEMRRVGAWACVKCACRDGESVLASRRFPRWCARCHRQGQGTTRQALCGGPLQSQPDLCPAPPAGVGLGSTRVLGGSHEDATGR